MPPTSRLRLYGRRNCHLCEDMLAALEPLRGEYGLAVEEIDIDADPVLAARYDEWVPVLATSGGQELCRHVLDATKVREFLGAIR